MKLIFCIDNKNGMLFNGRRQSMDKALRDRVIDIVGENRLFMNKYSANQFDDFENIFVDDDFLANASEQDYCFVENTELTFNNCSEIIIYNWNRTYPADRYFDFDFKSNGYKCISVTDFKGTSHKKITERIYVKK